MLAGLHSKHVASRPRTLSALLWYMANAEGITLFLAGSTPAPWSMFGRGKFGWDASRQELSPVRLLEGRMLVGTTSLSKITVSVRFVCRPL
jgi:hypothetical protein